jgi:hypothetical protein
MDVPRSPSPSPPSKSALSIAVTRVTSAPQTIPNWKPATWPSQRNGRAYPTPTATAQPIITRDAGITVSYPQLKPSATGCIPWALREARSKSPDRNTPPQRGRGLAAKTAKGQSESCSTWSVRTNPHFPAGAPVGPHRRRIPSIPPDANKSPFGLNAKA